MQVNVEYLENLRLQANFDDYNVISDQPIRYKGDATAPGPFDYFLASSAMCAAYFVKVYCKARDISTNDITLTQNNIIDPENRYKQTIHIQIQLPDSLSEKDKNGILAAMDRCSVKRVIQNSPEFIIDAISNSKKSGGLIYESDSKETKTLILGKDLPLEDTIKTMTSIIEDLGISLEIASWRNLVPHVWSVHIRDAHSPMCYTNGKGATKDAALCSALGEYLERISNNYFYNDYYLGAEISESEFVHYKNERWFPISDEFHPELMDEYLIEMYGQDGELEPKHLIDTNSGNLKRGICTIPFNRVSDQKTSFIPVNLIGNLFVSNGMSAGNTIIEARVQALSEIFERAIKNKIITEETILPDVPKEVIARYPKIAEGIAELENKGFPIVVKDASLGGQFPVLCVTLMNPKNGGVFASFGAHPKFEVALERSLTELLQGRSFEGMNDILPPTFSSFAISEQNNIVDHFIDSTGVISWKFFSDAHEYDFADWNIDGDTKTEHDHLLNILAEMELETYIADYEDLGAKGCRILVPGFSEIYSVEDLIWDNNNRGLDYRERILSIHDLSNKELNTLVSDLDESELDNYMPISELIGVSFDENSVWGQLNIGELKALTMLAVGNYKDAQEYVEMLSKFNDNLPSRKRFFQLLDALIFIEQNQEQKHSDYEQNLKKMFTGELYEAALSTLKSEIKFYGMEKTNINLDGLEKHQKLIESYKKLINKRNSWN
jgi:ribosomal protein S12 methylthiotransferase accessory factor